MTPFGLILFHSTHDAMSAEDQLQQGHFHIRLISTPQTLAKSCGFSIKYPLTEEPSIFSFIREKHLEVDKIFHVDGEGFQLRYHEV